MREIQAVTKLKVSTVQQLYSWREVAVVYGLVLILWGIYRLMFRLPVWFEEGVLKALVFGLPIAWVSRRHQWQMKDLGITGNNLASGVYLGIFLGIMLGLVGNVGNVLRHGGLDWASFGITSNMLGGLIILSLLTAFWEQLLFCGMFLRLIEEMVVNEWKIAWIIALLFAGLHLPALILIQHLPGFQLVTAACLLFLLELGNVILMLRLRNLAAPIMAQALWGVTIFLFR